MKDWRDDRIGSAINGTNPMVMAELSGGFVSFGDTHFLLGYCVLLPKRKVSSLNDLKIQERVNYDIIGNTAQFLPAHIFPRNQLEDSEKVLKPV